jgi:hypothetical protein
LRTGRRAVVVALARFGRRDEGLELADRVEGPLREDGAVEREHGGVRAAGDRERLPDVVVVVLVVGVDGQQRVARERLDGGRERLAQRAAV